MERGYYTAHGKPKRLFAKELIGGARRSLAAEKLKSSLASVEAKTHPRPTQSAKEIRSIIGHFKAMPDYRARIGIYPLWSLLAIVFLAHLCGAPRGQKDLEKFAAGLSDGQRGALGIESGLHQRLDVSHLDDLSSARKPSSMLFKGMFRRRSNSLCIHWISKQKNPHHKTTADFFNAMNANHQRNAIRSLSASRPSFSTAS